MSVALKKHFTNLKVTHLNTRISLADINHGMKEHCIVFCCDLMRSSRNNTECTCCLRYQRLYLFLRKTALSKCSDHLIGNSKDICSSDFSVYTVFTVKRHSEKHYTKQLPKQRVHATKSVFIQINERI